MFTKRKEDGFSLIEVSIILIIAGLLLSAIFSVKAIIDEREKRLQYYASVKNIGAALEEYVLNNGFYPAPASFTENISSSNYGQPVIAASLPVFPTDCNSASAAINGVFCRSSSRDLPIDGDSVSGNSIEETILIGAVPTTILGLSAYDSLDMYGRKYTYAISRSLIDNSTFNDSYGTIRVLSNTGSSDALGITNNHYVVVSHGQNQSGSYGADGSAPGSCASLQTIERANCDHADPTFRVATTGEEDDQTNLNLNYLEATNETASNYYDDAVYSRNTITKEMWTRKGISNVIMTSGDDSDSARVLIGRDSYPTSWIWDSNVERPQLWIEGKARAESLLATRLCNEYQDYCFKINDIASDEAEILFSEKGQAKNMRCRQRGLKDMNTLHRKGWPKKGSEAELRGVCDTVNKIDSAAGKLGGSGVFCTKGTKGIKADGTLECI